MSGGVMLSALTPIDGVTRHGDVALTGLACDSRLVQAGDLFAALSGKKSDGARFIDQALAQGAVALLAEPRIADTYAARGMPVLASPCPRLALAHLAARFYPGQPRVIAAVTGTNGKTSVAHFTRQIWRRLGLRAASLGTLGILADEMIDPLGHTTPDPIRLHQALADLVMRGIDHLAMEASSHGLHQYRLDGVKVQAGALTNITRDHLDYHPTFDDYVAAKMRLFTDVIVEGGTAVINVDGAMAELARSVASARGLKVLSVGTRGRDIALNAITPNLHGQTLNLTYDGRSFDVALPLAGGFQAENALVAAGLVIALGGDAQKAFAALGELHGVPGRLEDVARAGEPPVFVDYAHTPDALETVLTALRPHARGHLHVVFGCGGDRDRGKRPEMGAIAAKLADRIVITDDNPRSEAPEAIRAEILSGIEVPARTWVLEIGDRAEAIATAIKALAPGDVLCIAGKGHESGQTIAGVTHPFDDRVVARAVLDQGAAE